ncbi:cell wall protein RBR3-like [Contarinia nasturtii]|uniref:cell wall protein RBR3-like n=1 Tax=Contarinia nasturtii TaxID=265458 RepID=UPI0012D43BBE|nr:cell wall protein RBR3-like [Contarinia nasturtii]
MGPTQVSASYSKFQTNTLNPSERINPFDKNKTASNVTPSTTATFESTSSVTSSYTSSASGSTLDDLTKNRYDKYQGATATTTTIQSTSRYGAPTTSSSLYSSDSDVKSTTSALGSTTISYATGSDLTKADYSVTASDDYSRKKPADTITSKTVSSSQRANAAKYAFETSKYSTGSMSDSEIIFGSSDTLDPPSRRSQFGSNNSSTVDASKSIYESNRSMSSFNRSLSVSSDTNGDFANDPRVNTSYRIYEGINNAAFQDFDSPVKTTTASTTASSTIPETATSFSSTYISGSKIFNDDDDDDYDLK